MAAQDYYDDPYAQPYVDPWTAGGTPSIAPNTAPSIDFLGQTLPATTTPGVYAQPGAPPTQTSSGYNGPKDFPSIVRWWQSQHPATAPDMPGLLAFLNAQGIPVSTALHNGMASDDKILYNGQTYDLGSSLGGPDGKWFSDFAPMSAGGGVAGTLGGALGDYTAPFTEPFNAPANAAPFAYPDFQAPTGQDILGEPGYDFRLGEGKRAITNSAAAQGSLLTGGTFKGLQDYAQNFASGEYQNAFNRKLTGYQTNRGNAADTYAKNYQTQTVDPTAQAWQEYLKRYDIFRNNQTDPFNKYYQVANLGANTSA